MAFVGRGSGAHVCTGSPACWDPWRWKTTDVSREDGERHFTIPLAVVPDELFADGAEGGLGEEGGAELVALHHVDFGLLDGAAPLVEREQTFSLLLRLLVGLGWSRSVWKQTHGSVF